MCSVLVSEKPKAPDDDESESLRDLEGRPVFRESVRKGRRCVLCDELIASDDACVSAFKRFFNVRSDTDENNVRLRG